MKHEGGCFCRAVRYEVEGSPRRVTHCHCMHCRGTSGAPFLTWAEVDGSRFRIVLGEPAICETRAGVMRQFCSRCGTQLTYRSASTPATVDITVGSLDRPDMMTPEDHVWADRMLSWLVMQDDLPRFPKDRVP